MTGTMIALQLFVLRIQHGTDPPTYHRSTICTTPKNIAYGVLWGNVLDYMLGKHLGHVVTTDLLEKTQAPSTLYVFAVWIHKNKLL